MTLATATTVAIGHTEQTGPAEPVLNALRTEPPTLTAHPDHGAWIAEGADGAQEASNG